MTEAAGRPPWARLWRIAAGLLASVLILAALLLGLLRLGLALLPDNVQRVQAWVESQTGLSVEFSELDARLRWFGPEIVLRDVTVLDRGGEQALFETGEATVGLDLLSLFQTGELVAGRVQFVAPSVTIVRLADGRIRLLGLQERPASESSFDLDNLPAGRVEILGATLEYRDLKTGRGPWRLRKLDLVLERHHGAVAASGSLRLPEALGARVQFEGELRGSPDTLAGLDARVKLSTERLNLVGLADFLPASVAQPLAGHGPALAVLELAQGRLLRVRFDLDVKDLVLQLPSRTAAPVATVDISSPYREPGSAPLSLSLVDKQIVDRPAPPLPEQARYKRLAGSFRLRQQEDGWFFSANDVVATLADEEAADAAELRGRFRGHPRTTFGLQVSAAGLKLPRIWPLVLAFAPASLDRWSGLDPQGEVKSFDAEVVRERAGAMPRFMVSADLENLSAQPTGRFPGISGVSATLSGTDQRGAVALRANDAVFTFPRMFRAPLEVDRARSDVNWWREGQAWVLETPLFELEDEVGHAQGSLQFRFERGGVSPVMAIDARVEQLDLSAVTKFVPVGRLQPGTIFWLERAFIGGKGYEGQVSYRGPTRQFPFDNGEGEFTASVEASDATLDYYEGFPQLTRASGRVEFHNESMSAHLRQGRVGSLRLGDVTYRMADYRAPLIEVDATGAGDLSDALAMLQGSPLGPQLGDRFMELTGRGPAEYELQLRMATRDPDRRDYRVRTKLASTDINLPLLRTPLQKVSGRLELDRRSATASLAGELLGGPFQLNVEPDSRPDGVSFAARLSGRGRANGERLPELIGLPLGIEMNGTAGWNLSGRLERRDAVKQWPVMVEVRSDLAGLTVVAPRPLGKSAKDSRATTVRVAVPFVGRTDVRVSSGSAEAALRFARADDGLWKLERGAARFDGTPVQLPSTDGLRVSGDWPDFELAEWLAIRSRDPARRRLADWLGSVNVHLTRAEVSGFEFDEVDLRLIPQPDSWQAFVAGPMADGRITIPDDFSTGAPITLEMGRLELRNVTKGDAGAPAAAEEQDPRSMPALQVRAQQFVWGVRQFGWLQAEIEKTPTGLVLTRLATQSPHFGLLGSGSWLADATGSRSQLELRFKSDDLAAATRALGISDAVEASKAKAVARLNWRGGLTRDVLSRMGGELRLELDEGRITTVEPGAGRVLGLMSIVELPRRLSLDFRDVTDEGLAFKTVRGDFELRDGSLYTKNLLLKGPAVDIGFAGRTGIVDQDYDHTMVVSGNPTGPLAVAGALAAGPVIGAGVLVLSQLFKGQLQGLTRVYYRVTGPWSDPVVERVSAASQQPAQEPSVPAP